MIGAGVEPGGGAVRLVDDHLQGEGLQLELHDIAVVEVVLVDHLRPTPAEDDLSTMVGDLHPLVALITEPAGKQGHTARQWDLDPLAERVLEPWLDDEHVEVVHVQLDVASATSRPWRCALA